MFLTTRPLPRERRGKKKKKENKNKSMREKAFPKAAAYQIQHFIQESEGWEDEGAHLGVRGSDLQTPLLWVI